MGHSRTGATRREDRWAAILLVVTAFLITAGLIRSGGGQARPRPLPSVSGATPAVAPGPGTGHGALPASGPGTFTYERSTGPLLGTAGTVKRFHLAVESNLDAQLPELGRVTDSTLADQHGWTFDKKQKFQRVPMEVPAEFTIALVTRETASRLCRRVGLDIHLNGVPYTSCRANGWVVINLDRWHLSVPDYERSGAPLMTYRQYVINHEVGHHLGYVHEPCPGPGLRAPVMQQQTLGLDGCLPNPWPYPAVT